MTTASLRTAPAFVTGISVLYFAIALITVIYLFMTVPTFSYLWEDFISFGCNFFYVIAGALVWPGTLLAMLI